MTETIIPGVATVIAADSDLWLLAVESHTTPSFIAWPITHWRITDDDPVALLNSSGVPIWADRMFRRTDHRSYVTGTDSALWRPALARLIEIEVLDLVHIARSAGARYVTDEMSGTVLDDDGATITIERLREGDGEWVCPGDDDDDPVFRRAQNLASNVNAAFEILLDIEDGGEILLSVDTADRIARGHALSGRAPDEGQAQHAL
ncbi:hypothetical protein [Ilumatobacter sp.]|uniref:hypothetical protein n=1 Tax=Ilumatobacter sp. TaxID=1967498 RepID=UPI003752EA52